jgi:uncharacterized SAM-binding protein YcdF (DUF218 family)
MIEWVLVPGTAVLAWGAAAAWLDAHGQRPHAQGRTYDALVVAGCRVFPDGRPSHALARRVAVAVELWQRGVAPRIVLTGGPSVGAPISEAEAAARLCEAWGVPRERLVLEEKSTSTLENARFAAELLQGEVLVVSDAAHVFRCRRMFRRHFAHADAVGALGPRGPRVRLALREVFAVVRHASFGHL